MRKRTYSLSAINRYFSPVRAGVEMNLIEILPFLKKKGWNVSVHVTRNTLERKNVLKKRETISGVRVFRYRSGLFGFFPLIPWKSVDIVSIDNFTLSPVLVVLGYILLRKFFNKKTFAVIFEPHGGFTPPWRVFPVKQRIIKSFIHKTIGRFLINNTVDAVRAVSEWEKQELISAGIRSNSITTISNGIEKEAFMSVETNASKKVKKDVTSLGRYIIQIARIHRIKNIHTVIKALAYLPDDVKFVILGAVEDSEYMRELTALIVKLHLEDRVIFYGVVSGVDKYYLIKKSLAMVHMSLWEAYANVVIESMSQGKICVVSDIPSMRTLIIHGENGYRLPVHAYKSLARTLRNILTYPTSSTHVKMERLNRSHVRLQTWSHIVKDVEHFYIRSLKDFRNAQKLSVEKNRFLPRFITSEFLVQIGIHFNANHTFFTHARFLHL